jgi:hypothetical protein
MGMEVNNGLNFAVGWNRAGDVLAADARHSNLNLRLPAHEEKNHDHQDNREQNPEPRA